MGLPMLSRYTLVVGLVLFGAAGDALGYRTIRSEIETWPGVKVWADPTCSGRAAANVEGLAKTIIELPTPEKYHFWLRYVPDHKVSIWISGMTADLEPQGTSDRMFWVEIGSTADRKAVPVELEPGPGILKADVLVATTNPQWQPQLGIRAIAVEIEDCARSSPLKGDEYSGGRAAHITEPVVTRLELPTPELYFLYLRCYDNGRRDIGVVVNQGEKRISDYLVPIRWWKIGEARGTGTATVTLSKEGPYLGTADVLVATTNPRWSPQPHQIDLLGSDAIPPDVEPDATPPDFSGLQSAQREGDEIVLRWNPALDEGGPRPKFIAFHYLDDRALAERAGYLFGIGWDGINTIGAQWYESPEALVSRIPAYKKALDAARAQGMSVFFVKKALSYLNYDYRNKCPVNSERGRFFPDWFDDEQWRKQAENFRATGRFASEIGATGLALDQELYNTKNEDDMAHMWDLSRWEKRGHTRSEVLAKVTARGNQSARALLSEFPDCEILFFPSFYDARNPMGVAWYAGFFDAEPQGGIHLGTERLYQPKGQITLDGWRTQCRSIEDITLGGIDGIVSSHRAYWEQKCGFAHGAYPLDRRGPNYDPQVFRNQLAAFGQRSRKYVWMYTEHSSWYAPEDQKQLNQDGGVFDNSEFVSGLRDYSSLIRYKIYVSREPGEEDFSKPLDTVIDATEARVPAKKGRHCFVVRAMDRSGNEDGNCREICLEIGP